MLSKLKKFLMKLKKRFFRNELYEIKQLEDSIQLTCDRYNKIIEEMQDNYNKEFQLIHDGFNAWSQDALGLRKDFKQLQYRLCEFNTSTNIILYNFEIKQNNIFKSNFNPKVSIIIPLYNGSNYIRQAIDSAISQTYKNVEIIVVNDGSTDNGECEKIVLSYGDKIKYYKKENGGVSSALNLGIKNMHGNYFAWLSHDDIYYPNHIEEHINYLRHTNEENIITYTSFNIINKNSNIDQYLTVFTSLYYSDYKITKMNQYNSLLYGEINGCSVLIPKDVFNNIGMFDETLRISQERDMWSRAMTKYKFVNIPIITSAIRVHEERVSATNKNVEKESNKKKIEIIENLAKEIKIGLAGTEANFYILARNFYEDRNNTDIIEYIDRKLEETGGNK